MYNPNEMDNTQNEGLNIPQENKLEADAASTEQNAAEKAVAEEKNEPVQTRPQTKCLPDSRRRRLIILLIRIQPAIPVIRQTMASSRTMLTTINRGMDPIKTLMAPIPMQTGSMSTAAIRIR